MTHQQPKLLMSLQDLTSWTRDGIAGLQSVVLYSLPELDGAIDTVPLGGLLGNNIFLVPERVKRLSARLRKWVTLRRTPTHVSAASDLASLLQLSSSSFLVSQILLLQHLNLDSRCCGKSKVRLDAHGSASP